MRYRLVPIALERFQMKRKGRFSLAVWASYSSRMAAARPSDPLLNLGNSSDEQGRADVEPLGEFPHVVQRQGTVALEDHRRRRFGHSQERAKLPDLHPVLRDELAQDLKRLELRLADGAVHFLVS